MGFSEETQLFIAEFRNSGQLNYVMIKLFTIVIAGIILSSFKANGFSAAALPIDTSKGPFVLISPEKPLIEKDMYGYYLNFDITIKNRTNHILELSSVEVEVMDPNGKISLRKSVNHDGHTTGAYLQGMTEVKPGQTISIFNPFHTFQPGVNISSLKYGLFFYYADNQAQKAGNDQRLPIDYDVAAVKVVKPQVYIARNEYALPLKGKLIVWDGHDFYSRNRRIGAEEKPDKQTDNNGLMNESRYAYDLISVDQEGNMYTGTPFNKKNWFVFGKPVCAPAGGKVIAIKNDVPDNDYKGKLIQAPKLAAGADPLGKGNYIIIQHANGEYSELLNLEKGSITVKPGDMVKNGQQIALVGFSGNARYPQLHYTVTSSPGKQKVLAAEGVPNYFNNFKLYRGETVTRIDRSRIDSGDIVESDR